jgi:hypothetical protein
MEMANSKKPEIKVGEFFVENKIITEEQLNDALEMQIDNPERLVGEILVTLGFLTKEDLIMAMEMYLVKTDAQPLHVDEWLDQDEIDILIMKLQDNKEKGGGA